MSINPDPFRGASPGLLGPYTRSAAIVPADVDLPIFVRGLYVNNSGTLTITLRDDLQGQKLTLTVAAGQLLNFYARRVWATGTTASVVGLY